MNIGLRQVLTLVAALSMLVPFFFKLPKEVVTLTSEVRNIALIIASFAGVVGSINLLQVHGKKLTKRDADSVYSAILLGCLIIMLLTGLVFGNTSNPVYQFLYGNVQTNLHAAFFAMLCFYIASAGYRAFRIKNPEAAVMMGAALLVMLGNIPLGSAIWSQFPTIGDWLLNVPNTGTARGILFGTSIGYISMSVRTMLGLERTHLGSEGGVGS